MSLKGFLFSHKPQADLEESGFTPKDFPRGLEEGTRIDPSHAHHQHPMKSLTPATKILPPHWSLFPKPQLSTSAKVRNTRPTAYQDKGQRDMSYSNPLRSISVCKITLALFT
ncbi:hypothetical protein TNCV_2169191 [Trichonephila clavipes]|nr:hypothetical protein TNCV_2169191 [Trichonephila clavipes]